jgi:hypothetical protein
MARRRERAVRTMLRIAGRTMRPSDGLILRDEAKTPLPQDEGIKPLVMRY